MATASIRPERSLAPLIPVRDIRHNLVWGVQGEVSLVYRMTAHHEPALDDDGINAVALGAENAWSGLPDGTRYQIIVLVDHQRALEQLRRAIPPIPRTDEPSRLLEEIRQARMAELTRQDTRGDGFLLQVRRHYLVATFRPQALQSSPLRKLKAGIDHMRSLLTGRPAHEAASHQATLKAILREAETFARRIYRGLTTQQGMNLTRCRTREIVSLVHELLSPAASEVAPVDHLSAWNRENRYGFPSSVTTADPWLADTSPIASVLDDDLVVHEDRLSLGAREVAVLSLKELPDQTEAGMTVPLLKLPLEKYRLVYSVQIPSKHKVIDQLRAKTTRAAGLEGATVVKSKRTDALAELIGDQTNQAMRRLIATRDRIFGVSLSLVLIERTTDALEGALQETLGKLATTGGLRGYRENYNCLPAFLSLLPGAPSMGVNRHRRALTPTMVDMLPIWDFRSGKGKIPFLTPNNAIIFHDNFDTSNQFNCNGLILAPSGTGKSVTAQMYFSWYQIATRARGEAVPFVFIIDAGASYKRFIDLRPDDSRYIQFDFEEAPGIDVFDFDPVEESRKDHLSRLEGLLVDILRVKTPDEEEFERRKVVLERALLALYPETGEPSYPRTFDGLTEALREIDREAAGGRSAARAILEGRLNSFVGGGKFSRLCEPNELLALSEQVQTICYDMQGLLDHPDFALVALRLIIYQIRRFSARMLKRRGNKTLLIIDESWALLDQATGGDAATMGAGFLASAARMGRKEGLGCLGLSQSLNEYMATSMGKTIVENSSTKLIGPPSHSSLRDLQERLQLNDRQVDQLRKLQANEEYREFLLIQDNVSMVVRMPLDPLSWAIFTTDPNDIKRHKELEEQHPELNLMERVRLMAQDRRR